MPRALYRLMPRHNRALTLKTFWDTSAQKLNAVKGGALKSGFGWSQYLHYLRLRIKQRIAEITYETKICKVPEDDYIPVAELDRLILLYMDANDDEQEINYVFDPTKSQYWKSCTSKPAAVRKRRHTASDIVITKRKKRSPSSSEETNDEDVKAPDGVCESRPQRNADSDDVEFEAPAILRRSLSFTDMSDAIKYDRKIKLEVQAERTKNDPESVKKREIDRVKDIRLITQTLRATMFDSRRILSVVNTVSEILKNNPRFRRTISKIPTIF
ncbi:uncharacterized protein LOC106718828 isoform X2 [Papilio machaon]|uniref:uncharacterized protein LOC106718828 isoform X2 n=1 Tax=Papilio machaon TaxID=76193 RepID=UPI001E665A04|nr:uncharacterized protein LOC106718828 isoform X2 [Papilio machaon]